MLIEPKATPSSAPPHPIIAILQSLNRDTPYTLSELTRRLRELQHAHDASIFEVDGGPVVLAFQQGWLRKTGTPETYVLSVPNGAHIRKPPINKAIADQPVDDAP